MGLKETLNAAHRLLTDSDIDHALIGGLGLAVLGVQRATFDVDFLVEGSKKSVLKKRMEEAGWRVSMETEEVLHFEGRGRIDFLLAKRPLAMQMLSLAKETPLGVKCVSAEGIIGLKIQAYKNDPEREFQDKADIKSLIAKSPNLNWVQIKEYADLFGEWPFIETLMRQK